ncbi:MAG: DUF2752 domain-containing protein [Planctomycetota bacterium]|nr:MAG: DUF2752 domain-containing protein [Planctomycetota bacterium]
MQASQQLNKPKIYRRASSRQRLTAGVIFLVVGASFGLFWVSGHYKTTLWPFPCGFKQKYGLPCPGCGITTSAVTFAQGRILEAFYIQPAGALLCCLLALSAFLAFLVAVFGVYFGFLNRFFFKVKLTYVILALIVVIAGGWAVTLARALAANRQG